jgi:hypothetical protein
MPWFDREKVVCALARYKLLQNTHNHHHNYGRCRRKHPPHAPNEASSPVTSCCMDGKQPPKQAVIILGGVRGCMAIEVVLLCSGDDASPQHRSVLRALHPLNLCKNICTCSGGLPHWAMTTPQGLRPHVERKGAIFAGVGHGWLWLRGLLLAIGGWWHHIFVIPT